jgi:hypothetical protein
VKRCSGCSEDLPLDAFGPNKARRDGLQTHCRPCRSTYSSAYYERTKVRYADVRAAASARAKQQSIAFVHQHLAEHPCVDCGNADIRVLEFDHLGDKTWNISVMLNGGYPPSLIASEIAKCDVVCANCHRIRTYSRGGSWRIEAEAARLLAAAS